jgi:hypothetical protein
MLSIDRTTLVICYPQARWVKTARDKVCENDGRLRTALSLIYNPTAMKGSKALQAPPKGRSTCKRSMQTSIKRREVA